MYSHPSDLFIIMISMPFECVYNRLANIVRISGEYRPSADANSGWPVVRNEFAISVLYGFNILGFRALYDLAFLWTQNETNYYPALKVVTSVANPLATLTIRLPFAPVNKVALRNQHQCRNNGGIS